MNKKRYHFLLYLLVFLSLSYFILAEFPGSVTINTPIDRQNISGTLGLQTTIATLDDNTNVTNVTFEFDNGNGTWQTIGINATENLTVYAFDWDTTTTGGDGINFTINITALFTNQTANLTNEFEITSNSSTIENVTVDNTGPTITINEPTDNAIINTTTITFNFTAIDTIFTTIDNCNLTLDPTNSSDGSVINTTTIFANGTETIFINTVPDGVHTWNVACTDNVDTNNTGYSANSTFNGGATASSISIDLLDSQRTSKTLFAATDTIIIACTRSDEDGFNETIVSVSIPGLGGPLVIERATELIAVNDSRTLEVTFEDTRELGDYLALCEVTDVAGNTNSTNISFTIQQKLSKSNSAFANKNFAAPIAKIKVGGDTVSDAGKLTDDGFSRLMRVGATTKFSLRSQDHSLSVKELSDEQVTLIVRSTPMDIILRKGETKNIDVDQDGQDDLEITFHKQFNRYADLTVSLLTSQNPLSEKTTSEKTSEQQPPSSNKQISSGSLFTILLVIIVLIFIGYFSFMRKKR